jgi:hypothetical protein
LTSKTHERDKAIKAAQAAVALGDDVGAKRDMRLAISYVRSGAATFREMQRSIDGIADAIRAEAVR